MSNLWSGSIEADERVNAEVLWQPCHGAGPSAESYLKLVWIFLHADR